MWIAIRLPRLPLEIFLRGSSTPEPFAVEERHCVFACDRKAFARGVRAGMAVQAALALAPALRVAPRDPATETEALLGVAGWAAQFAPGVALEFPDGVLLEVSGSLKLFGGLESLLGRLRRGLAEMGWSSVLAGAPTPRAAFWLAWAGKQQFIGESAELEPVLAALPLEVLRCNDEALAAFEAIGVRTLGELRALPREGIARRFGQGPLAELDRALGRLSDPRNFFVPPARFGAALSLPADVTQAEALLFAARRLIIQLAGFLAARSGGVQRFVLSLRHRDKAATEIAIGLVAPSRDAEHFILLLRERLFNFTLAEPVREISLRADDVVPLAGHNLGLRFEQGKPPGQWEHLVERLRARLGADAVYGLVLRAEHRPERAVFAGELDSKQLHLDFGERPFWLLDRPKRIAEIGAVPYHKGPLELLAGPERIESGWWDGDDVARDYFVARTQSEALVWIYREWRGEGGWYLHGVFA
ncbi:MAG: DNA polymerase Y family protein [Betaproteobacteria bacterium]|nr:MAG: DNA polymerase Y family protein [Betaproteobacteria bacterium]